MDPPLLNRFEKQVFQNEEFEEDKKYSELGYKELVSSIRE